MKFTLHSYQANAVEQVLRRLDQAKTIDDRDGQPTSFSLTATTGAGKTVMAAAVIEALFYGNEALDFDPDPGAVVIWFSDDPNLNDQSRGRLMEASDKLRFTDLVTVAPPFARPKLEAGKVYFLNTQRLGKNSLLTRGHDEDPEAASLPGMAAQPDLQGWTIWETIANTINDDELTLYLVLDEAHRGFNRTTAASEKPTIVRKLISGHAGYPPIPIVWGISATIERFQDAMAAADADRTRRALDPVMVDGYAVQESGLVKDNIVLDIPAETGDFDTVLVKRAARKLRESTERWESYAKSQNAPDVVRPLLVLQAPNTPDPDQIGRALDAVFEEFQELSGNAVRHVLGDHSSQKFGGWEVDWIEPQRVQDEHRVRVLVAKDAISTGWDCPRAEVLVSFRPARDHTHITQLLGRMVRNPLARRVPGDDKLNSVDCILPFFDRTTAGNVVRFLTGQIEQVDRPTRRAIIEECLLVPNTALGQGVWACWDALPTMTLPQRGASPVKRLTSLGLALSNDGLRAGALDDVRREMHSILDDEKDQRGHQVKKAANEVWAVRGQSIAGRAGQVYLTYEEFEERADDRAIQVAFTDAKKAFGGDIAQSYVNYLADADGDDDADLRDAFVLTSALATVPAVRERVDREADDLATRWFQDYDAKIVGLNDDRQQEYEVIRALATEPQVGELKRPRTRVEDYIEVVQGEQLVKAPLVARHLMADEDGQFPLGSLNKWERELVRKELSRESSVGWYRNPPRQAVDSLGVTYRDEVGNWRSMHPDFVFFNEVDGEVKASIVDPHGHHLEDSMVKLQGLAKFAAEFGDRFDRIHAVTKVGLSWRILDLKIEMVREAILGGRRSPLEMYESDVAIEYDL